MTDDDDLDRQLFRAMRVSPWHAADDLAARAMARAQACEADAMTLQAALAAHRRRARAFSFAIVLALGAMLGGLAWMAKTAGLDGFMPGEPPPLAAGAPDGADEAQLSDEAALLSICGALVFAALVYAAVDGAVSSPPIEGAPVERG